MSRVGEFMKVMEVSHVPDPERPVEAFLPYADLDERPEHRWSVSRAATKVAAVILSGIVALTACEPTPPTTTTTVVSDIIGDAGPGLTGEELCQRLAASTTTTTSTTTTRPRPK